MKLMATHGSATARKETSRLLKPITIGDQTDAPDPFEQDEIAYDERPIEALTDLICGASNEAAAALLVLMAMLESSVEPKALANTAKHYAFTRCGELNLYGMVDAQIEAVERRLFAELTVSS
jgi:hypothetical protein